MLVCALRANQTLCHLAWLHKAPGMGDSHRGCAGLVAVTAGEKRQGLEESVRWTTNAMLWAIAPASLAG